MAARANPKKKATAGKGRIPSRGKVATLPKKKAKKRARRGDNSGDHSVPDEVYERHLNKIDSTAKAMERAKLEYDQAKGVHQSAYKAAKGDGCDTDAIKLARKMDTQDHGITQIMYANVARVLNIMESPLGSKQMDLFGAIVAAEPKPDPEGEGFKAGKEAEPIENNPYEVATENFVKWEDSWKRGQAANAEGAFH